MNEFPECKHRRSSRRNGVCQLHCFLKRSNCTKEECKKCDVCNLDEQDYRKYARENLPAVWTVDQPSRGLGDTIAKVTHATGVAQTVHAVADALGVDCGCDERQERLNEIVPFDNKGQ